MKFILAFPIIVILSFFTCCIVTDNELVEPVDLPLIDSVFEYNTRYVQENYEMQEVYVPMRDGAKLRTFVYSPKDKSEEYPIMMLRTPYAIELSRGNYGYRLYKFGLSQAFYEEKFIFVFQDVRGKFMSEGEYENMRPQLLEYKDSTDIDESTDTYDAVDWLTKNIENNNGNVGMWGISYPGFYAAVGACNAHPALKAVSPQAPIADWWWDDFHHNGAFMLNASFGFFGVFGLPRPELSRFWPQSTVDTEFVDGYKFYLDELVPLENIDKKFYKGRIPFWNDMVEHPNYDKFWQERSIIPHMKNIKPAVLTVGGLFDAEDLYGPLKIYNHIEKNSDAENHNYLVMGPWFHGGWARSWGTQLGDVYFGENPAPSKFYQDKIELTFFKHYLKDDEFHNLPEAYVFETGGNKWRAFETWPPENIQKKELYFHENGKMSFEKPEAIDSYTDYVSDPENPVPFAGYITNDIPKKFMTDDQSFASERSDVVVFQTDPLEEDLTLAGNIIAKLNVAITGSDADFVVKLIDVYPDDIAIEEPFYEGKDMEGFQQMVRGEVMRGRFRNSFEFPEQFVANEVTEVNFELLDVLHTFKKGHRIMIQVQSSWFPLVDINPQKYVENIYKAEKADFIKSTQKIYHSKEYSTSIEIGILVK
jgi:uncharacterized protein